MVLPGVLEKHKLGYVRGGEITPSGRVCLQSHSGWVPVRWLPNTGGGRGLILRGLPSSVGSRHLRNRKEKQEGPYSCRSSPPANQATRLTFFFRWLKKRSAEHLISPRRKIATSWGALLLLPNHRLRLHRDGLSVNNLGACPGQAQAGCA